MTTTTAISAKPYAWKFDTRTKKWTLWSTGANPRAPVPTVVGTAWSTEPVGSQGGRQVGNPTRWVWEASREHGTGGTGRAATGLDAREAVQRALGLTWDTVEGSSRRSTRMGF